MNDMGSCSFAGLRDRGSFLRLFSMESGFCSRVATMGPGAAGWHRRRSVQHCHRSSMAICYLVVSSTLSHCPQPLQETEAEFVPSQLCTHGFSLTGRHRYPEKTVLALKCWKLDYLNVVWTLTQPLYFSLSSILQFYFYLSQSRYPQPWLALL